MDTIKLQNRHYKTKLISIDNIGECLVASTILNNRIISEDGTYTSKEAILIDEQIYFFVEPHILRQDNDKLTNYVRKNCL